MLRRKRERGKTFSSEWVPYTMFNFGTVFENPRKKVSFNIASEASYVYITVIHFGEFLKTWKLRLNSVTRQVNFNRTKVDGKCQIFYPALSGSSLRSILGKLFKVEIDFAIVAIEEFCRQKVRDLCEGSHYSCARMRRGAECILKVRASGQARVEMARANKRWGQQMVSRLF